MVKRISRKVIRTLIVLLLTMGMCMLTSGIFSGEATGPGTGPGPEPSTGTPSGGQPAPDTTTGAQSGAQPGDTTTRPADDPSRRRLDPGAEEDESEQNLTRPESESLYTIVLDDFERSGEWLAKMPIDQGIVKAKELYGAPSALKREFSDRQAGSATVQPGQSGPPPDRRGDAQQDRIRRGRAYFETDTTAPTKILGVRVEFMQRGYNWFTVEPPRPINLDGLVKAFELWVCGRNQRHELYIMVDDFNNEARYVKVGMLNFIGWKRMTAPIPYTIRQSDFRRSIRRGLTFKGFLIKCHPMETIGKFYMYFDNLSVELSRFLEENRDRDDPLDIW